MTDKHVPPAVSSEVREYLHDELALRGLVGFTTEIPTDSAELIETGRLYLRLGAAKAKMTEAQLAELRSTSYRDVGLEVPITTIDS